MALWPFGKRKKAEQEQEVQSKPQIEPQIEPQNEAVAAETAGAESQEASEATQTTDQAAEHADAAPAATIEQAAGTTKIENYDPIGGSTGPFDGDSVEIEDFDFSDFSDVTLNLGSVRIPMPKGSQVQVEMGDQGPKMVHIVTEHGRLTPVAFAAPRTGGLWEESAEEIGEGMRSEGMPMHYEEGPWGREVVGEGTNGTVRIIGVEGPRWLFRVTLAAPTGREEAMAQLGREVVARSFVYRGQNAILSGNSLPVTLPQQLAAQVQQAVEARAAQAQGQAAQPSGEAPATGSPNALSDALRQILEANAANRQNNQQ